MVASAAATLTPTVLAAGASRPPGASTVAEGEPAPSTPRTTHSTSTSTGAAKAAPNHPHTTRATGQRHRPSGTCMARRTRTPLTATRRRANARSAATTTSATAPSNDASGSHSSGTSLAWKISFVRVGAPMIDTAPKSLMV